MTESEPDSDQKSTELDSKRILHVQPEVLESFMVDVFNGFGVPKKDAKIVANVLITSDLRGIDTHGVQRLKMYCDRIKAGIYNRKTKLTIIKETPTTAVIDGNFGLGPVIAYKSMKRAIKKAKKYGFGAVAVRNSTHFGIAGYYSLMAIKEGMIGITTTNARPMVPPTFGVEPLLGTNPLTMGAPTDEKFPFLIDCATSIIQRGKVEVYNRLNKPLPEGLVISKNGKSKHDPQNVLHDLDASSAALLPLGGKGENTAGHKGYGYATFVELLSSALQKGIYLRDTAGINHNGKRRLGVGHFFLAMNLESFIGLDSFKNTSGNILRTLRESKKEAGAKRIYTAGEKEHFTTIERKKLGIPLNKSVLDDIKELQEELHLSNYAFDS